MSARPCWRRLLIASAVLVVVARLATAQSEHQSTPRQSKWWSQVEPIDGSLHNGRWKYARRKAIRLSKTILNENWKDRELDEIPAELALYRAIADVRLGQRETASWYWHTALNLNRRIAERDLTPYGPMTPPEFPDVRVPTLLNNSGAARQRSADFEVEVLVDETGKLHQPVVVSRHLNPVAILACLDWLYGLPTLEPARFNGQPVVATYTVFIEFLISPYSGALVITEETD